MWRIFASMGLMVVALACSTLGLLVIFLFVPSLWEALFGSVGAPFGALLALAGLVWCSARIMRLADRLLGEAEHRRPSAAPLAPAEVDVPTDWPAYTADIVQSKRWAFYRRTRQFDRLAELEGHGKRRDGAAPQHLPLRPDRRA